MEEELISFETAVLANKKGFLILSTAEYENNLKTIKNFKFDKLPKQGSVQKWLRDEHNIYVNPVPYNISFKEIVYRCRIIYFKNKIEQNKYVGLSIYEDALEIGLQEALKLIK